MIKIHKLNMYCFVFSLPYLGGNEPFPNSGVSAANRAVELVVPNFATWVPSHAKWLPTSLTAGPAAPAGGPRRWHCGSRRPSRVARRRLGAPGGPGPTAPPPPTHPPTNSRSLHFHGTFVHWRHGCESKAYWEKFEKKNLMHTETQFFGDAPINIFFAETHEGEVCMEVDLSNTGCLQGGQRLR